MAALLGDVIDLSAPSPEISQHLGEHIHVEHLDLESSGLSEGISDEEISNVSEEDVLQKKTREKKMMKEKKKKKKKKKTKKEKKDKKTKKKKKKKLKKDKQEKVKKIVKSSGQSFEENGKRSIDSTTSVHAVASELRWSEESGDESDIENRIRSLARRRQELFQASITGARGPEVESSAMRSVENSGKRGVGLKRKATETPSVICVISDSESEEVEEQELRVAHR